MEPATFHCDHCDREFKTNNALIAHARVHREPQDENRPVDKEEAIEQDWAPPVRPLTIWIKRLPHGAGLPDLQRATPGSAAFDLYAANDTAVCLGANERATPPIPTGIAMEIPEGYVGKVVPRSGLSNNHGVGIINAPGIIDADYRGEIKIGLINHSRNKIWINRGDRIAQMLIERVLPIEFQYVDELSETSRGTGGFGSTGV